MTERRVLSSIRALTYLSRVAPSQDVRHKIKHGQIITVRQELYTARREEWVVTKDDR